MTMLFSTDAMRAIFDRRARIQRMLDVEAALARAESAVGVIPSAAASAIAACASVERFDVDAIEKAARNAGNLAIPLVSALTRAVAADGGDAKGYVHWGATSQDVIDTGLVLQLRDALEVVARELARLRRAVASQAERHRDTVMVGRTWLQQGTPVTLGLKFAAALAALDRDRARLDAVMPRVMVVQLGGATGTLASLAEHGIDVQDALARELGLAVPPTPWHTQRDALCELACAIGILVATLGKLARDMALLGQTEVGEVAEPAGESRGGSSTMPQKRNPVGASIAIAAAVRAPGLVATMLAAALQEHERGLGNWPAEWETLPALFELAAGALDAMIEVSEGLEVHAPAMRRNLDASHGLVLAEAVQMALAASLGRDVAHKLVAEASARAIREGRPLRDVIAENPKVGATLGEAALDRLFEPANYLGSTAAFVDRALRG